MSASRRAKSERPRLSLSIQLGDRVAELPASRAQLRRWVVSALRSAEDSAEDLREMRLTLRFVGEVEARALNRDYRGRDYATNVLTFAYDEVPHHDGYTGPAEADIVICLPVLAREARARRIPPEHHLAHLVVHGVMHACGHDHELDDEARDMEAREARVLARFGIPDPYRH